jgi:hypothetical protein
MAVLDQPTQVTDLQQVKALAGTLESFNEDALRNILVRAAGAKLSSVAD